MYVNSLSEWVHVRRYMAFNLLPKWAVPAAFLSSHSFVLTAAQKVQIKHIQQEFQLKVKINAKSHYIK